MRIMNFIENIIKLIFLPLEFTVDVLYLFLHLGFKRRLIKEKAMMAEHIINLMSQETQLLLENKHPDLTYPKGVNDSLYVKAALKEFYDMKLSQLKDAYQRGNL